MNYESIFVVENTSTLQNNQDFKDLQAFVIYTGRESQDKGLVTGK